MKEVKVIAEILDNTRRLTRWYFSFLDEDMMYYQCEFNGDTLNSAYWIAAHLTWTEHVIVRGLGGADLAPDWVHEFKLGNQPLDVYHTGPDFNEVWSVFNSVHKSTVRFISEFSDDLLDQPFPDPKYHMIFQTNRLAFYHLIRHEGYHCGQLGIICKLSGIQTI